jgi:hypothetical protein
MAFSEYYWFSYDVLFHKCSMIKVKNNKKNRMFYAAFSEYF